jgi:hypothetical protein
MSVKRDLWVGAGIVVSATSAAVASFAGLKALAGSAGWPSWSAPLLPLTVDALAATASRVWVTTPTGSERVRRFARSIAVAAVLMSVAGNAVAHLIGAGLLVASWPVVVIVGAVPALTLALVVHLAVLHGEVREPRGTSAATTAASWGEVRTPSRTRDELLELARRADSVYRASHDGRPITRDALRAALHVSVRRASEVRRALKEDQDKREVAYGS